VQISDCKKNLNSKNKFKKNGKKEFESSNAAENAKNKDLTPIRADSLQ